MRYTGLVMTVALALMICLGASCPAGRDLAAGSAAGGTAAISGQAPVIPPDASLWYVLGATVVSGAGGWFLGRRK